MTPRSEPHPSPVPVRPAGGRPFEALPFPCEPGALEPASVPSAAAPAAAPPPLPPALEAIRWTLVLLLWALWLAFWLVWGTLSGAASPGRTRMLLGWAGLALAFTGALMYVPVAWGWMELVHEAENLAMKAGELSDEQILTAMKARAYRQGFPEVVGRDDLGRVERTEEEDGPHCRVRFAFTHSPKLGVLEGPAVPIRVDVNPMVRPARPAQDLLLP